MWLQATASVEKTWIKDIYYRLRPLMPVSFRKHLQGIYLRNWEGIAFPNWPLDRSVDILHERLLHLAMTAAQIDRLPLSGSGLKVNPHAPS
jgi:hypothetical protein